MRLFSVFILCAAMVAPETEGAVFTVGTPCHAYGPSMQNHSMAEVVAFLGGDALAKLLFHLEGVLAAVRDTQKSGDSDAVGVADIALFTVYIAEDQIGGLSAYTGQFQEVLHIVGDLAIEFLDQHTARRYNIPRLGTPETGGVDDLAHFLFTGGGKRLQSRKLLVQYGSDHIYPCVRALSRHSYGK